MKTRARYLIILIFFLLVIIGMFFIYSTVESPEKVVYFKGELNWFDKFNCIIKGGKMEALPSNGISRKDCLNNIDEEECFQFEYICHYR